MYGWARYVGLIKGLKFCHVVLSRRVKLRPLGWRRRGKHPSGFLQHCAEIRSKFSLLSRLWGVLGQGRY